MRLLLVEDDRMIGDALRPPLERAGIAVDWVRSGSEAKDALKISEYAIVLLDIGLPDVSGLEVLAVCRGQGSVVPILLLTARDAIADRVQGLDIGADDYLVKPFDVSELLARIRALTRRRAGAANSILEASEMRLNLATQELEYRGNTKILSAREFALMRVLLDRPGTIVSRSQFEERIYGWDTEIESNAIDVLIHSVRRQFEKSIIRNVRGAGWMVLKGQP